MNAIHISTLRQVTPSTSSCGRKVVKSRNGEIAYRSAMTSTKERNASSCSTPGKSASPEFAAFSQSITSKYFYNFFSNFASLSEKYTTFAFGEDIVFAIFLKIKKRIALTCRRKRRKFSF